jgi:hypothetical protein
VLWGVGGGMAGARDPKYTLVPQRERLAAQKRRPRALRRVLTTVGRSLGAVGGRSCEADWILVTEIDTRFHCSEVASAC